jgi:phytoene dehydrogenase-like protein
MYTPPSSSLSLSLSPPHPQNVDTLVLERRHLVGGAAVTEEIVPGFKFSRASYLAGLLRPQIIEDLQLEQHGFRYLPRDPASFTPSPLHSPLGGRYLMLGECEDSNHRSIAQFSQRDADAFPAYERFLGEVREVMQPLLDGPPPDPFCGGWRERVRTLSQGARLLRVGAQHRSALVPFYELFTGPASQLLDRWFESEMLKTTLATDAVIGAMVSPTQAGSAYVLLHHVMGEAGGRPGVWSYVQGGMGAISEAVAASARQFGADIALNATVRRILYEPTSRGGAYSAARTATASAASSSSSSSSASPLPDIPSRVTGVELADGTQLYADVVLSGASPYHTFMELLPGLVADSAGAGANATTASGGAASGGAMGVGAGGGSPLPGDFQRQVRALDHQCGAFKINLAVDRLPNFECLPNAPDGSAGPQHQGTVHFENSMEQIEHAYREASMGVPASRPVVEMTIPSAVDPTLAPPGKHVVQLFVQYAPYQVDPKRGNWADPHFKREFVAGVYDVVEEFAPGFRGSIVGEDALSPLDLERVFGLQRGNLFHGALALHQLGYARPAFGYSRHRMPLDGLYLCGSGAHPGGGVMGAPGRNCANVVLSDLGVA